MRRLMILGMLGCVAAALLVPSALQADEPAGGGSKPRLPSACEDAFAAADEAFQLFDEAFGTPGDEEDLGVIGDIISLLSGGEAADDELDELSAIVSEGQSLEIDFYDEYESCLEKVRT